MDEDTVHISDSDEAKASISRLLKAIEGWATKESQKGELELTAFSAALASESYLFTISLQRIAEIVKT